MKTVLITGGSGLIGSRLTDMLLNKGYKVHHLSRTKGIKPNVNIYRWNVNENRVEDEAFEGVSHIVHLAGAGIADESWTKRRKQEIINSRVMGANLIFKKVKELNLKPEAFISASGVGCYGSHGERVLTEDEPAADDFLGETCQKWEEAAQQFLQLDVRVAILRTGLALSAKGGALPELAKPLKYFQEPLLGSGRQIYPWIHINDLCELYIRAIENPEMSGTYNAVAPNPVSQEQMMDTLKQVLRKRAVKFHVPELALKAMMGKRAQLVTDSINASSEKIQKEGFKFKYPDLEGALKGVYS